MLKLLGPGHGGLLSFPMEGYTLALDFPLRTRALPLLDALDAITHAHGGRVYLAKGRLLRSRTHPPRLSRVDRLPGRASRGRRRDDVRLRPVAEARAVTARRVDTALVVGATSDIGRAVARRLAAEGYALQLAARDPSRLDREVRDIRLRTSATVTAYLCDVLQADGGARWSTPSIRCPTWPSAWSGCSAIRSGASATRRAAERVLQTNYVGPALLLGALAERFAARGSGTLVGVSSVAGERGRAPRTTSTVRPRRG